MIYQKDPITMATISLFVSFILLIGILYLARPVWLQVFDKNTGKSTLSWQLIFSYSATFALVISIAVITIVSNQSVSEPVVAYQVQTSFTDPFVASAYCGSKQQA